MTEENVELARRAYEAFNRGDLDGMVADFASTFEYVPWARSRAPGTRIRTRRVGGSLCGGSWASSRTRVEVELTEAGDQVLTSVTLRGPWKAKWRGGQLGRVARLDRAGWQVRTRAGIRAKRRSPTPPGCGVDDVAGERLSCSWTLYALGDFLNPNPD